MVEVTQRSLTPQIAEIPASLEAICDWLDLSYPDRTFTVEEITDSHTWCTAYAGKRELIYWMRSKAKALDRKNIDG